MQILSAVFYISGMVVWQALCLRDPTTALLGLSRYIPSSRLFKVVSGDERYFHSLVLNHFTLYFKIIVLSSCRHKQFCEDSLLFLGMKWRTELQNHIEKVTKYHQYCQIAPWSSGTNSVGAFPCHPCWLTLNS